MHEKAGKEQIFLALSFPQVNSVALLNKNNLQWLTN